MFKKTMTFDDLDGNEVTQTFYFNFKKKEVAELIEFGAIQEFADPDREYLPLEEALAKLSTPMEDSGLSNVENNRQAYRIFQDLILDAYGVKGADNVSFDKSKELRHYFSTHLAFDEMIFEFIGNPALAGQFIEKCLPPKIVAAAKADMQREHSGRLSEATLSEMVAEADRRQQDPATRIEPGLEAARAALGEDPLIEDLALSIADTPEEAEKNPYDLTAADIEAMDQVKFDKLDPQKLSQDGLRAAFLRKTRG